MLWIVLLGFGLAGGLMILTVATRVQQLEQKSGTVVDLQAYVTQQEIRLSQLVEAVKQLSPGTPPSSAPVNPSVPQAPGAVPATPPSVGGTTPASSPSGILSRGSLSSDGSKFAGYEDVKVGKKGIAVELLKDTTSARKERYIVIFNALTESTGVGTAFEKEMSVRWKDAKTIEYDVLVKVKGEWKKETREVQIFI